MGSFTQQSKECILSVIILTLETSPVTRVVFNASTGFIAWAPGPEGARAVPGSWPEERCPQLPPVCAPQSCTVAGAARCSCPPLLGALRPSPPLPRLFGSGFSLRRPAQPSVSFCFPFLILFTASLALLPLKY